MTPFQGSQSWAEYQPALSNYRQLSLGISLKNVNSSAFSLVPQFSSTQYAINVSKSCTHSGDHFSVASLVPGYSTAAAASLSSVQHFPQAPNCNVQQVKVIAQMYSTCMSFDTYVQDIWAVTLQYVEFSPHESGSSGHLTVYIFFTLCTCQFPRCFLLIVVSRCINELLQTFHQYNSG